MTVHPPCDGTHTLRGRGQRSRSRVCAWLELRALNAEADGLLEQILVEVQA